MPNRPRGGLCACPDGGHIRDAPEAASSTASSERPGVNMSEIYYVRHGETDANVQGLISGGGSIHPEPCKTPPRDRTTSLRD